MKELVAYYNDPHIVCLYAADAEFTGIDMSDAKCRQKYCLTASDYSHLNADGMYMVSPIFDKWLADTYASFKGLTVTNSADEEKFLPADEPVAEDTTTVETPVTNAPETNAPETTPADTTPAEEKGCGGFVALGIIACIIPAAVVVLKKKD